MDEQRIIDLEIRISHQEVAIDALQQALYEQQKALERLRGKFEQQTKVFEDLAGGGLEIGPANEKPPHY